MERRRERCLKHGVVIFWTRIKALIGLAFPYHDPVGVYDVSVRLAVTLPAEIKTIIAMVGGAQHIDDVNKVARDAGLARPPPLAILFQKNKQGVAGSPAPATTVNDDDCSEVAIAIKGHDRPFKFSQGLSTTLVIGIEIAHVAIKIWLQRRIFGKFIGYDIAEHRGERRDKPNTVQHFVSRGRVRR